MGKGLKHLKRRDETVSAFVRLRKNGGISRRRDRHRAEQFRTFYSESEQRWGKLARRRLNPRSNWRQMAEFQGDQIVIELNGFELSTEKVNRVAEN